MKTSFNLKCGTEQALAGLLALSSTDELRKSLCGISLEVRKGQDSIRAVATDGHAMGMLELYAGSWTVEGKPSPGAPADVDLFLPWDAFGSTAKQAAASIKRYFKGQPYHHVTITFERGEKETSYRLLSACNGKSVEWKVDNDLKFPRWRRVLPDLDSSCLDSDFALGLNAHLLSRYFTARYGAGPEARTALCFTGPDTAIMFTDEQDSSFLGIAMPRRAPLGQDNLEARRSIAKTIDKPKGPIQ